MPMPYTRSIDTATIPNGGTTSDAITLPARRSLAGIKMPAAFTGASVTFEMSTDDGSTWNGVFDGGSVYSVTVTAGKFHAVKPEVFFGVGLVRIVSVSTEAAARSVGLVLIS